MGQIRKDSDPASINVQISIFFHPGPELCGISWVNTGLNLSNPWSWFLPLEDFTVVGDLRALNVVLTLGVTEFISPCSQKALPAVSKEHLLTSAARLVLLHRRYQKEPRGIRTCVDLSTAAEFFRRNCKKRCEHKFSPSFFTFLHPKKSKINIKRAPQSACAWHSLNVG